jgi:hypothetical protein
MDLLAGLSLSVLDLVSSAATRQMARLGCSQPRASPQPIPSRTALFPHLILERTAFRSFAPCFLLMCHEYQVRSVFFTYARLYAFSRMLMTPSTPSCIVKGNAVVVVGVGRRGDGRNNATC